jgi:hypothetical protein
LLKKERVLIVELGILHEFRSAKVAVTSGQVADIRSRLSRSSASSHFVNSPSDKLSIQNTEELALFEIALNRNKSTAYDLFQPTPPDGKQ